MCLKLVDRYGLETDIRSDTLYMAFMNLCGVWTVEGVLEGGNTRMVRCRFNTAFVLLWTKVVPPGST